MKWQDLSLKWKLTIPIGVIMVLVIFLCVQQYFAMKSLNNKFYSIYQNYVPSIEFTRNAERYLYQALASMKTIEMGRNVEAELFKFEETLRNVQSQALRVRANRVAEPIRDKVIDFLAVFEHWEADSLSILYDMQDSDFSNLSNSVYEKDFQQLKVKFNDMRIILEGIVNEISVSSNALADNIKNTGDNSITALAIVAFFIISLASATLFFFPRFITAPISALQHSLEQIADGKGDLSYRLPAERKDEIGFLSATFNRFLDSLQSLMGNIANSSETVKHSSSSLDQIATQTGNQLSEQYEAIGVVATAVTQMSASINEVSKNAQDVAQEVTKADTCAQDATNSFQRSIHEMDKLASNVNDSSKVIKELESDAADIVLVLDVIKGIAEQTNLLALNAAIEAARAGEQGRGFAVVADEVRQLASRTQESTQQINEIIERLQNGVNESVKMMSLSQESASETVQVTQNMQSMINDINDYLTSINDRTIQVATAVDQQASVVDNINQNIERINDISKETSEQGEKITQFSQSLLETSTVLRNQIGHFSEV
ncbi:MAG: methyl-accepting chemotaxis protein [Pseudomonadota bacterium]